MDGTPDLSRRGFIVAAVSAAGGLAIGFPYEAAAKQSASIAGEENPKELTAWLVIDPDNTVTVRVPHQEMGQGTATALAMLVAEELECDWSKVRFEHASANRNQRDGMVYKGMMTVGSQGVRTSVSMMQQAGASARERLRLAAAQQWKVDPALCSVENGKVVLKGSGKSLDYGALAPAAAKLVLTAEPAIKTPAEYKHAGKWTQRLDTPAKLDGSAQFGIDAKVEGMVYAAVSACPVFGGKLKSVDDSAIKGRRGIIAVVREDDFVAVVADRFWRARKALDDLAVEWDVGASGKVQQAQLDRFYLDATDGPLVEVQTEGDVAAAFSAPGARIVEATYEVPYLSHSPMEPMNCTVKIAPDRVDVWISTQAPMNVLKMASEGTGLPPEQVYVHNAFIGGGFGRRGTNDELPQAIKVAKAVGKPVKLIWTREEDVRHDRYRPQAAVRFKAAVEGGKAQAFESRIAVGPLLPVQPGKVEPMATECIARSPYTFPARRIAAATPRTHVPVSFWRGVGGSQNGFFIESFVDEMALAAGKDPLAFRRAMLDRPEILAVLDVMADKGNWGQPLPKGKGRGMAILETYGSISGQVVEVSVSPAGELTVDRVVAVIDCYNAVNPNTIAQQMEGAVIFALSAALYGEITIKDGAAEQSNFDSYQLVRMNDMPRKIDVHLPLSGGPKWGGIGEPGVAPLAPALCNAIYAATGKRIRRLPIRNTDLSWA